MPKKVESELTFSVSKTKKNLKDIKLCPEFVVGEKSTLKEKTKFDLIKDEIEKLEIDKCITISIKENESMFELKRKVSNIVFGHTRKHTDKKFKTGQVNKTQFEILRTK